VERVSGLAVDVQRPQEHKRNVRVLCLVWTFFRSHTQVSAASPRAPSQARRPQPGPAPPANLHTLRKTRERVYTCHPLCPTTL